MVSLAGEMKFMQELAHAGKIAQGIFVANLGILDPHGEAPDLGIERGPLGDRPAAQAVAELQAEIVPGELSDEERGRVAGAMLADDLAERDPITAAIFREIVAEEVAHVALADTYFGWRPE